MIEEITTQESPMPSAYSPHGNAAVITLDNPPVNGLGHALRSKIVEGVTAAQDDAAVSAIVLIGAGKAFSGGADIREFGTPKVTAEPTLSPVLETIQSSEKPVIPANQADAMGG